MLSLLRIKNFAIVEESEIEFGPGLNVLSGETGAGKSIILKAIELLTGGRASPEVIRTGTDRCSVEGVFTLSTPQILGLQGISEELSELISTDELIIRRVIEFSARTSAKQTGDSGTKSKIYLNGSLVTLSSLEAVSEFLIDITGQHSQQTLLKTTNHLRLLDEFGIPAELLSQTNKAFRDYEALRKKLELYEKNSKDRLQYLAQIEGEFQELSKLQLRAGEREDLEQKIRRLANVETLASGVTESIELLCEGDNPIDDRLRELESTLTVCAKLDPKLTEGLELVKSASVELREAQIILADFLNSLEADPNNLESMRERLAEIARVERKYKKTEAELEQYCNEIAKELALFTDGSQELQNLRKDLKLARENLQSLEIQLTSKRKELAKHLTDSVQSGLAALNMKRAAFVISFSETNSSPTGADHVEFLLAANAGEPARPLSKVASGGELSRILLVLKTVLNERSSPGTQIFDEIDAGIGGAVAQVVGEKLKAVSKSAQVILVTHAPQIAAFAEHHFLITKSNAGEKTLSSVSLLDSQGSLKQIASMLAGKDVSEEFTRSAQQLLNAAKKITTEGSDESQKMTVRTPRKKRANE